jgi:hypothetical protein
MFDRKFVATHLTSTLRLSAVSVRMAALTSERGRSATLI